MKKDIFEAIDVSGYKVEVEKKGLVYKIKISKDNKSLEREFKVGKKIDVKVENGKLVFKAKKATKKEKKLINTMKSHVKNMKKGLEKEWVYKLEICYSHFPINVSIDKQNKQIVIKNFFGEKKPRYVKLLDNVDVEIKGNIIEVKSCDKELAGMQASLIENATRITNRDRRIFQDGIWIIEKAGKPV
jgi:large subunit ribosomal protein L6